jgi:hypothetical protein
MPHANSHGLVKGQTLVTSTPVPEPATLALLGAGLLGPRLCAAAASKPSARGIERDIVTDGRQGRRA